MIAHTGGRDGFRRVLYGSSKEPGADGCARDPPPGHHSGGGASRQDARSTRDNIAGLFAMASSMEPTDDERVRERNPPHARPLSAPPTESSMCSQLCAAVPLIISAPDGASCSG